MERDTRYSIGTLEMNREEHFDSEGRLRLFWVLREEHSGILHMTKTWEDMVLEMMLIYDTYVSKC